MMPRLKMSRVVCYPASLPTGRNPVHHERDKDRIHLLTSVDVFARVLIHRCRAFLGQLGSDYAGRLPDLGETR
jgi:hypothetical protein